jgi:tetratricopeptide (TPR) repeat protein
VKLWSAFGLIAGMLICSSCMDAPYTRNQYETACTLPDLRLAEAWDLLEEARATPGGCDRRGARDMDHCRALRNEIERIAFVCPNHIPSLMTTAVLAYEAKDFAKAGERLDSILQMVKVHPEAAVLRARIALEEGNLAFTLNFLKQRIELSPDHAQLREVYAATLFLSGRIEEARTQLSVAEKLGAPRWRVAYHLGLFEERKGEAQKARRLYQESSDLKPGWNLPVARLHGLLAWPLLEEKPVTSEWKGLEFPPIPK